MALSEPFSLSLSSHTLPTHTQNPPPPRLTLPLPQTHPPKPLLLQTKTSHLLSAITLPTKNPQNLPSSDPLSVAFPALLFANMMFFKSAYNVQVVVGESEPEEKLIGRFRREVLKAGVIQECKRRRFFETSQEKKKRKTREAAKKNRRRRPQPKASSQAARTPKKKHEQGEDNWEDFDVDVPYC